MAKFNESSKVVPQTDTVNMAGGDAYSESDKLALASVLLTSFVGGQYYESAQENMARIATLVGSVEPLYAAKAAVFARTEFGMRSVSHVVAGELARIVKGEDWTKRFYNAVVKRVDDMAEILAYYKRANGSIHPLPNSVKKGFALALRRQDEYTLGKYRMEGKDISLVDIVNLVRPLRTPALDKLMNGELRSETYQTGLTQAGQNAETPEAKAEAKAEVWVNFVYNPKVEYFALLRNLRNIMQQADDNTFALALATLTDKARIKKSLVLPFRFMTAMEQFDGPDAKSRQVRAALSNALDISVDNVPVLDGTTLVAVDVSGSMSGRPSDIASLFAAVLAKSNNADVIMFSNNAAYKSFNLSDSVSTIAKSFHYATGGTNFKAIFNVANKKYDRIIILSDMQAWMTDSRDAGYGWYSSSPKVAFNDYRSRVGANPHIFSFDLAGHGTLQFPEEKVYALAGFSEHVFDIMATLETDREALVHRIEAVEF